VPSGPPAAAVDLAAARPVRSVPDEDLKAMDMLAEELREPER